MSRSKKVHTVSEIPISNLGENKQAKMDEFEATNHDREEGRAKVETLQSAVLFT